MIKSILILLIGIIVMVLTSPLALIAYIIQDKDKYAPTSRFGVKVLQAITSWFCRFAGCDYVIEGRENLPDTPAVYAGNHQGDFDAFLILFALGDPKVIMVKKEARVIPIAHLWMLVIKCIFVDRKNHEKALAAMKQSQDYLEHGRSILYFPEGTRSQGPDMGPFKGGAFKTAVATGTQIVPFAIDGTYKVFERQRTLVRETVKFHILPPVPVSKDDDPKKVSAKVKQLIQDELDRMRTEE